MKTGVVPLAGNDFFLYSKTKNSIVRIFCCSYNGWTNCLAIAKTQKSHKQAFRIFIPEKECFGCRHTERLNQKILNYFFRIPYQKWRTLIVCFVLLRLAPEILHVDPKKTLFLGWDELGSLGSPSTWNFSDVKHNKNPKGWMLRSLLGNQNKLFENFRSSRFGVTTQKCFFREKNPGRLRLTFLRFGNG